MSNDIIVDVLLVEDDANDAELTRRVFRKKNLGDRLTHVTDGEKALAFLDRRAMKRPGEPVPPLVVLLDLQLPRIDGFSVLRTMKESDRMRKIPVVVLTSSRSVPDVETAYALGANSYVVKPVAYEAFEECVSRLGEYWLALNEPAR